MKNARILELLNRVPERKPLVLELMERNAAAHGGRIRWDLAMQEIDGRPEIAQDVFNHLNGARELRRIVEKAVRR